MLWEVEKEEKKDALDSWIESTEKELEMNQTRELLSGWLELSGLPKFTTTMLPFLLGAVVAWAYGCPIDWVVLLVSLLALFLITDSCFVLNACSVYADLKRSGVIFCPVDGTSTLHSTAVSGRFNALAKGHITERQAAIGSYLCILAALPISVLLQFYLHTGPLTLPLGIIGMFIAYAYSRGPQFSYHGLGEIALTIGVGWWTVISGYYLQAHQISWLPIFVALPWVIDVFKLKLTREIPDFECDQVINRRNLAIRMGKVTTVSLYLPLTVASWLAFVPILFLDVPYIGFVLLALPMFFTAKSLISIQTLKKSSIKNRDLRKAEVSMGAITKDAFTGMILIPVALIGMFVVRMVVSA
jgi:1,4-dihydroxy-2-naphthoate octaprenyltransferase